MKKIDKIMDIIEKICLEICMVRLVVIVAEIFLQVIIRKLGFSVTWVDEASRYCYILMILCGSGAVMRKGAHIRVTSFIDLVPARIRKVTEVLTFLLVAGMSGLFAYCCYYAGTKSQDVRLSILTFVRMRDIYMVATIFAVLIFIAALVHAVDLAVGTAVVKTEKGEMKE